MPNLMKLCAAGAAAVMLSACDGTIYRTSELGDVSVLSVDARQRLIVTGTRNVPRQVSENGATVTRLLPETVTCAEPSPDAIVAQATALAGSATTPEVGAQIAASLSESAANIGLRTQSIQLLRDGYYRICEAYLNGAIEREQYRWVIAAIDQFMITLVSIEAVTGVIVAPALTIGANGEVTIGADGSKNTAAQSAQALIKDIQSKGTTLTDAQTKAVIEIVRMYHANRPPSIQP